MRLALGHAARPGGGIVKASALILCPRLVASKARVLEQHGILAVVLVVCFVVGGYFTWFGYFGS
jgi:predicted MFS family arabinose efflux permease